MSSIVTDNSGNLIKCPKCGSTNVRGKTKTKIGFWKNKQVRICKCSDCGAKWEVF